jgi:hypothetical protein
MKRVFEYAVVRVVPRVEREEFVNAGVILFSPAAAFLGCKLALDEARLRALDPSLDEPTLDAVRRHLESMRLVAAGDPAGGPNARLGQRERFHFLVAPRSTMIQVSAVHSGLCDDPAAALEHLAASLLDTPRSGS